MFSLEWLGFGRRPERYSEPARIVPAPIHPALSHTHKEIMRAYYARPKAEEMPPSEVAWRLVAKFVDEGWLNVWMSPRQIYDAAVVLCMELNVVAPSENRLLYEFRLLAPLVVRDRPPKLTKAKHGPLLQQYEARGERPPIRPTVYVVRNLVAMPASASVASRPSLYSVSHVMTPVTQRQQSASKPRRNQRRKAA